MGEAGRNKCLRLPQRTACVSLAGWRGSDVVTEAALEGLEAGGQIIPVVQKELLTGLEGVVELGGEASHIGGHVVEKARGGLIVVGHLQDRKSHSGKLGWGGVECQVDMKQWEVGLACLLGGQQPRVFED